jgi:Tfp pilus assembly protein PilN
MVTLNLLPDIKREYLRSQRTKRLFMIGSLLVSGVFVALAVLLAIYVFAVQRLEINGAQSGIDEAHRQLGEVADLEKMLTVQKQLEAMPGLHSQKPAMDRLFDYLSAVVPTSISLSSIDLDISGDSRAEINGFAEDFPSINAFTDSLKSAVVTYEGGDEQIQAFNSVVVESYGVDNNNTSFRISLQFEPRIFDNTLKGVKMTVPNTTNDEFNEDLFNENPGEGGG